ncbi:MAG: cell division control protein 6 [Methanoculleus sp. SDB]|nr:MAG: cell division control protein 6 [Methanoculleus sp. SDB]
MMNHILRADQTLFRDRDVFEIDHMPDEFPFRDAQLKELAFAIRPVLHGSRPLNTVLRGLPGTGKTTSVKRLFAEVGETTRRVVPVYVNCQNDRTLFAVFATIFARLFGHIPPTTGIAFKRIMHEIGKELARSRRVLVVCLDDANYLLHDHVLNTVLYSILRLYEEYPGARAGVIATLSTMDTDFSRELDGAVMSVFCPNELYFSPYDEEEIREILLCRARQGLFPGVLSGAMLDLVVRQTMRCGDLRVGLELVKQAVIAAERDARKEVVREDVCAAFAVAKHVHLAATVKTLTAEERLLLRLLAELSRDGGVEMASGAVYAAVKERMPMSYTLFYERVRKLDELRLIDVHRRPGRGRTREIVLRYGPEEVMEACG